MMKPTFKTACFGAAAFATAVILAGALHSTSALAQTQPPAMSTTAALPEATVKALQEALNKQGIAVKTDGLLNEETRTAIRKYQTQHHLPVTGEPDKATLDKLGVAARQSAAPDGQTSQAQAGTTGAAPQTMGTQMMQGGMMMPGGMMNCPMMGGQAQSGTPGMMQGQTSPGQMPSGPMRQGGMMMSPQMMQGMIQMMMGMMQMMQSQMQQGQPPTAQ
jgi:hypothetical protein